MLPKGTRRTAADDDDAASQDEDGDDARQSERDQQHANTVFWARFDEEVWKKIPDVMNDLEWGAQLFEPRGTEPQWVAWGPTHMGLFG